MTCLLVTRPQPQADRWVAALREAGCRAEALPLLAIEPRADERPLREAWRWLLGSAPPAAVMFVSSGALAAFLAGRPAGAAWPIAVRAAATGPGTAAALSEAGVPGSAILQPPADSSRFDSEALWARLQQEDWRGRDVWLVRGEDGRDWLAERWQAAGARLRVIEAYRRVAASWGDAQQALAQAAALHPQAYRWLFSSSQSIAQLAGRMPDGWLARTSAGAIATHPRIAEAARAAGFDPVVVCLPTVAGVVQALHEAQDAGTGSLQSGPS